MAILRVLGQVHIADDTAEEDIRGKEQFKVCVHCICSAHSMDLHNLPNALCNLGMCDNL